MKNTPCLTPCTSVKTNRTLLTIFAAFAISWLSWLSVTMINSRTETKIFMAEIKVKLTQIQKDIVELKMDQRRK